MILTAVTNENSILSIDDEIALSQCRALHDARIGFSSGEIEIMRGLHAAPSCLYIPLPA